MLNWHKIRVHNNSQNNAFEELVCQLARHDPPSDAKQFHRLGTQDGGVECFWELIDGAEIGWQAKYVFSIEDLISQVDKSIHTAVKNHPTMSQYVVATPFNLPDSHHTGKSGRPIKSAKTKWIEKVTVWKKDFAMQGRNVDIVLWDESYLNDLLIAPQNEGMRYYWFNGLEFTLDWFKNRLESTIKDLGPRYTPKLNIELDIAKYFDLLLRNERQKKAIQKYTIEFDNAITQIHQTIKAQQKSDEYQSELSKIFLESHTLLESLPISDYSEMQLIQLDKISLCIDSIEDVFSDLWMKFEDEFGEKEFRKTSCYTALNELSSTLYNGRELFSEKARLLNYPFMLLHGEPGVGKSHLIADVCSKLIERGYPSVLLLGDQFFASSDPREQIKQYMQFKGNFEALLQLFNSIGQFHGQRFLFAIDALNEGSGTTLWPRFLAGLENEISRYPWISLIVSIRDDYLKEIIPHKSQETMIDIEHRGFEDNYDFVCDKFFAHYDLNFGLPIFNHEFTNPLFLKLFCESCKDSGYPHTLPSLPGVFNNFVEYINKKLHKPFRYDQSLNLVNISLEKLAELILQNDTYALAYSDFHKILDNMMSSILGQRSTEQYFGFLDALIREGVLRTYVHYSSKEKQVGFAYDRMRDYYLLLEKLNRKPDEIEVSEYINTSPYFSDFINMEYSGKNTIELLSIVLPERYDIELVECFANKKVSKSMLKGLLQSFQWRSTIVKASQIGKWLKEIAKDNDELKAEIITELLHVAAIPRQPFNISFVHQIFLSSQSMAQIDDWWAPYINKQFEDYQNNIIKRIVNWCWKTELRKDMASEPRYLLGITLAWFCCATNRELRDRATKGLVSIYIDHIIELPRLFDTMSKVGDIYIIERLYAAAYGAVMHSKDKNDLRTLSDYYMDHVFHTQEVIPHILIRDYARNVVEYSIYKGNYNSVECENIRSRITPPYKSAMPVSFPSDEDIKALEEKYEGDSGFVCICHSMNTGSMCGDFGKYILQYYLNDFTDIQVKPLKNWCIAHILELGYDPEIHDTKSTPFTGRGSNRVERIGKKYQWIVLHELLARISDNYVMKGEDYWSDKHTVSYSGPWDPHVRDIDPSLLINKTQGYNYHQPPKAWYSNFNYLPIETDSQSWIQQDVIDAEKLILMTDTKGVEWYSLCYYPFWSEYPADFKENRTKDKKSMRGYVYSFLCTRGHEPTVWELANTDRDRIQEVLNDINWYTVFDKEYYWAPAYSDAASTSSGLGWKKVAEDNVNIIQTTQRFLWEEEYDYSKDEAITYDIPTDFMCSSLGMNSKITPGYYYTQDQLVCFNPSICLESNHSLLIRKDALLEWLERNALSIIWMVTIEKYVINSRSETKLWADYHGAYRLVDGNIEGRILKTRGSK